MIQRFRAKAFTPSGGRIRRTALDGIGVSSRFPKTDKGKRISIEFDGVYREALVALNGFYIGQHRGGYDPFRFDVTDFIIPGAPNVLLVRVEATQSDGWFYEGAGIYRHTWLVKTAPVHVKQWGTFVRSTMQAGSAQVKIRTEVANEANTAAERARDLDHP